MKQRPFGIRIPAHWERKSGSLITKYYIAQLQAGNEQERYKWEALRNFQQTWDMDTPDFKEMFSATLQAASTNLWESFNCFPKKMIEIYSGIDPEAVRSAFRSLYDEDRPVDERITRSSPPTKSICSPSIYSI